MRYAHRWLLLGAGATLVLGAVTFACAPALICRYLEPRMPMDVGNGQVITMASTHPLVGGSQVTLSVSPDRATTFVNALDGVWLPPGLIRSGATVQGTGLLPRDLVPYGWRVQIESPCPRPSLIMRFTCMEANELFAPFRRFPVDRDKGIFITYVIHDTTIRDDDQPGQSRLQRRLRLDASGIVSFHWKQVQVDMPVAHLIAHLDWRFEPVADTLVPGCVVTIDSVDAQMPKIPFMPASEDLWRTVEERINRSLAKRLPRKAMPDGSPIEAVVDVQIGDGPVVNAPPPRVAYPLSQL
ncbi:MAG: hypothetical protein H0V44_06995 [Planctomycetes bacterium]|nr:hypothetical protein [Planctomycetota bacterium]